MKLYEFDGTIGDDTTVLLKCEFTPEQKQILYPTDRAQPGWPADLSIYAVMLGDDDLFDDLSDKCIVRLEESAMSQFMEDMEP